MEDDEKTNVMKSLEGELTDPVRADLKAALQAKRLGLTAEQENSLSAGAKSNLATLRDEIAKEDIERGKASQGVPPPETVDPTPISGEGVKSWQAQRPAEHEPSQKVASTKKPKTSGSEP